MASCNTDTVPLASDSEGECDENSPQEPIISAKGAQKVLIDVRAFLQRTDVDDSVFSALVTLVNAVYKGQMHSAVQKKMTVFILI